MKKRLYLLLVCGIMAVSLMACGGDKKAEEETAAVTESAKPEEKEEAKPDTEESTKPKIDLTKDEDDSANGGYYITVADIGNDEYEITVDNSVDYVEFYACELNDNMEYVLTDYYGDFDTSKEKSFDISYNTVSDFAAEAIIVTYSNKNGEIAFALERDGVDGSVTPVEVVLGDSDSSADSNLPTADDYLGIWGSGRVTLEVTGTKGGAYNFTITCPDSANTQYQYVYLCDFDASTGTFYCEDFGDLYTITYSADGSYEEVCEATTLTGEFAMLDGNIIWYDITGGNDPVEFVQD